MPADTLAVGRGLCDPAAVRLLVEEGIHRIGDLERMGVRFDRDDDGGYRARARGRPRPPPDPARRRRRHRAAIAGALIAQVAADPRIDVMEHTAAIALAGGGDGCVGAWVLGHDELGLVRARMTLLATGGACALFARTPTRPAPPATASRSPTAPARPCATWSSSSSTPRRWPAAAARS